jgi:hypothetical protein
MRKTLPAYCISLLTLCCICAHALEKLDGDTNRPVSDKIVQSMFYKAQHQETGNMWERAVTLGRKDGRVFTARFGDGALTADALANLPSWPGPLATTGPLVCGVGFRGGP